MKPKPSYTEAWSAAAHLAKPECSLPHIWAGLKNNYCLLLAVARACGWRHTGENKYKTPKGKTAVISYKPDAPAGDAQAVWKILDAPNGGTVIDLAGHYLGAGMGDGLRQGRYLRVVNHLCHFRRILRLSGAKGETTKEEWVDKINRGILPKPTAKPPAPADDELSTAMPVKHRTRWLKSIFQCPALTLYERGAALLLYAVGSRSPLPETPAALRDFLILPTKLNLRPDDYGAAYAAARKLIATGLVAAVNAPCAHTERERRRAELWKQWKDTKTLTPRLNCLLAVWYAAWRSPRFIKSPAAIAAAAAAAVTTAWRTTALARVLKLFVEKTKGRVLCTGEVPLNYSSLVLGIVNRITRRRGTQLALAFL